MSARRMDKTALLLLLGGGCCSCVVLLAAVGLVLALNWNSLFGGGAAPCGSDNAPACAPKYSDYLCPPPRKWGAGAARGMCCNEKQDNTQPQNCSAAQLLSGPVAYSEENFSGTSLQLKPGMFDKGNLAGIGNDNLSSVFVPKGWRVDLYQDQGCNGSQLSLTASEPQLGKHDAGKDKWNNTVSCLRVSKL